MLSCEQIRAVSGAGEGAQARPLKDTVPNLAGMHLCAHSRFPLSTVSGVKWAQTMCATYSR